MCVRCFFFFGRWQKVARREKVRKKQKETTNEESKKKEKKNLGKMFMKFEKLPKGDSCWCFIYLSLWYKWLFDWLIFPLFNKYTIFFVVDVVVVSFDVSAAPHLQIDFCSWRKPARKKWLITKPLQLMNLLFLMNAGPTVWIHFTGRI